MSHPKESFILGRLLQRQDPTYRDFHKKLLPTMDPERLIGVRTPQLRSLAKELSGTPEAEDFLASLPHMYYDENTLHGLLISNGKDISWVIAQLDRFLPFVDIGYWFDEGKQISFGEWQKLAIARTFSKDADVIFLDEPNSALDAISDYEISQLYQKLFQDKMGIIIAHKFNNLINQVNNILVIENGRLAESGTHTELLHQGKIYYEMYQLQNKNSAVL